MYYFDVLNDLSFIKAFKNDVSNFYNADADQYKISQHEKDKYIKLKEDFDKYSEEIAKKSIKATDMADRYGVLTHIVTFAPSCAPGPELGTKIFEGILNDNTYGKKITSSLVFEKLNQVIGQMERQLKRDLINIINPFFWVIILFKKFIRFPFELVKMSGFNIEKIEDNLIAKCFKLLEAGVIIWFCIKYGLTKFEIGKALMSLLVN